MIRLKNVEKSYPYKGGRTWVLRRIDANIREGEFITIMGPSGAGSASGRYVRNDRRLRKRRFR